METNTDDIKMVLPTLKYKNQAEEFIRECYEYESDIHGVGSLDTYLRESYYESWLDKIHSDVDIANIKDGKVPSLTYFYVRESDNRIVGMVNIRLALNEFLSTEGGHIGYSIRPSERRKGYAVSMLSKALKVLKVIGVKDAIVTCGKDNKASAKTIQKCGGQLDSEFYSKTFDEIIQRYIIKLGD